jgi:hypothetical protein
VPAGAYVLDDTFDDWERGAPEAISELAAVVRIRKTAIDVEALAAWCRQEGQRLDGAARRLRHAPS